MVSDHKQLIVWQKGMDVVTMIYSFTKSFPKEELFGLVSQMRRSAVSIPCNISEGRKRGTEKDYRHFLLIALGSAAELETQLEICRRLQYGDIAELNQIDTLLLEVLKMLSVMTKTLR
ncbi:MAG: four helix bundle protein [Candidatus Peribacteraceae bacterium]|nr:four helix bundle protein [Candidatus Peribacteraceae bacterium]